MAGTQYLPRMLDAVLAELLGPLPAVLLVGPRGGGKTTTARRHTENVFRLDRPAERDAMAADPDAVLRSRTGPLLIDEWQMVPEVLGAVKRAVDDDRNAGPYLLTGSVEADFSSDRWPGTGRVVRITLPGMTVAEQLGRGTTARDLVDDIATNDADLFTAPSEVPDLVGYLELAARSGFPEPSLHLDGQPRRAWLTSYVEHTVARDLDLAGERRDPTRVSRFLEVAALNSAGAPTTATLLTAAGIDRRTSLAYERLLERLFVIDRLPAWTEHRLNRLARTPKLFVADPAIMLVAAQVEIPDLLRSGDLLGRFVETFAVAQIRAQRATSLAPSRLFHLRDRDGNHEIDLIIEIGAGQLVAIEIKANASVGASDARHLAWLRDQIGDRFVAGAVLHTGPRAFRLGERILALPLWTLWRG